MIQAEPREFLGLRVLIATAVLTLAFCALLSGFL